MKFTVQAIVGGRFVAVGHKDTLAEALAEFRANLAKYERTLAQHQKDAAQAQEEAVA